MQNFFENFKRDLGNALGNSSDSFDEFDHIFTTKLNKHAGKKEKLIREKRLIEIYVGP